MLLRKITPISHEDTTAILHDRLAILGADAISEALAKLDTLSPEPQQEAGVTYADKIDKAEARIDWSKPAESVDRCIRGLSPFPGAWTEIGGERVKVLMSRVGEGSGDAGTIIDQKPTVACGSGAVELLRLQRGGKGAQDAETFLRGFPIETGTQL